MRLGSMGARGGFGSLGVLGKAGGTVVSGSIRASINTGAGASGSATTFCYRCLDKSNITIKNPCVDLWNGWVNVNINLTAPEEVGVGNATAFRHAFLTGCTAAGVGGNVLNQTGATVWQSTFFKAAAGQLGKLYNLQGQPQSAAQFTAAGGSISGDGTSITLPDGWYCQSDEIVGLTIQKRALYANQTETNVPVGNKWAVGTVGVQALGDARAFDTSGVGQFVYNANWSGHGGFALTFGGGLSSPVAVWGTGPAGTKVAAIDGDSVMVYDDNTANTLTQTGDADGCQGYGARAMNLAGYSYVNTALPGADYLSSFQFGGIAIRNLILRNSSALFTDMGGNNRSMPWLGAAGTGYLNTYRSYWNAKRAAMKGGTGRIVAVDLSCVTGNATIAISSLTSVGTTATATVADTSTLINGNPCVIAGASPSAYNGTYNITIVNGTTFTYTFAGGTSPATGTITVRDQWASLANQTTSTGTGTVQATSINPFMRLSPISISSLTSSGTTATATVANTAYLITGATVVIAGASPAAYNGTYTVTVVNSTTFTYTFAGGTSPATGTITATGQYSPSLGDPDAAYIMTDPFYAAAVAAGASVDVNHFLWPANGAVAPSGNAWTVDGGHPSGLVHQACAADLAPKLPALLGF